MTFLRNEPYLTRVHVSAEVHNQETLLAPPHWHETHDEFFRIVKGRLEVMIGSNTRIYVPEDGEICIPKGVVHSLRGFIGEETIFEERTEPMDEGKELFFRNLLGSGKQPTNLFMVMQVFYHGDARPSFPGNFHWLENMFVTIVGGYIAPMLGYKLKYEILKRV